MDPQKLEPPFQLTVRTDRLRQYRAEATLLIRLGAIANALLSIGRAFRVADQSLTQIRDQVHYTALIASFAVEAGRIVNETDNLTWQLAEAGLATASSAVRSQVNQLRSMLTKGSTFLDTCAFVRDQHTFHIDAKPVLRWLNSRPVNDAIILQTVEGAGFTSCLFDASASAVRAGLPSLAQQPDFTESLVRFAAALPLLLHAMTRGCGLLIDANLVVQKPPEKPTYEINIRPLSGGGAYSVAVEIRPVGTSWSPFYVGMPSDQAEKVRPQLRAGGHAGNSPTRPVGRAPKRNHPGWWICLSSEAATADGASHYLYCTERPGAVIFGQVGGEQHGALMLEDWGPRKISGIPQAPIVLG